MEIKILTFLETAEMLRSFSSCDGGMQHGNQLIESVQIQLEFPMLRGNPAACYVVKFCLQTPLIQLFFSQSKI